MTLEENRTGAKSGIAVKERKHLDMLFQKKVYTDYKWIDPNKLQERQEINRLNTDYFFYSDTLGLLKI